VNHDSFTDLLLHFSCRESGLTPADTRVYLYGRMSYGEPFTGSDSIWILAR
jgi:hypothetical protein